MNILHKKIDSTYSIFDCLVDLFCFIRLSSHGFPY